jgi:hypothetical protein
VISTEACEVSFMVDITDHQEQDTQDMTDGADIKEPQTGTIS